MRRLALPRALALAVLVSACVDDSPTDIGVHSAPTVRYSLSTDIITELGWLSGGTWSKANAVNSNGVAAGVSVGIFDGGVATEHAALFKNGGVTDLGVLGGIHSTATGINDAEVVVGYSTHNDPNSAGFNHAFEWTSTGGMASLNPDESNFSVAYGINNSGVIVGDADKDYRGYPEAVKWSGGGAIYLGALCNDCASSAHAISDAGHIVGNSNTASGRFHGFIIAPAGTMQPLPPLAGYDESNALGVNNNGDVVGYSLKLSNGTRRATLWQNGQVIDLGEPFGETKSEARAINDDGQIVGGVYTSFTESDGAAVIWQNGSWGYLPYVSSSAAHGINATGTVAGREYHVATGYIVAALWNAAPALPDAPSNVTAMATSHNEIWVQWTDNSYDETRFTIQRRTRVGGVWSAYQTIQQDPANGYLYIDDGLSANTEYQYRVRACNLQGCSVQVLSESVFTLDPPTVAPSSTPSNTTATVKSKTSIRIDWYDFNANEDNMQLQRRVKIDGVYGAWSLLVTLPQNTMSYTDGGLPANTNYQYRVRACNSVGCSTFGTSAHAKTPALIPAAPTALSSTVMSATRIDLAWSHADDFETSFTVQRRIYIGGVPQSWITVGTPAAGSTSYSDGTLSTASTYQFRVRACNETGCSGWALGKKLKTL